MVDFMISRLTSFVAALIFLLVMSQWIWADPSVPVIPRDRVKFGEVSQDETWEGEVYLVGDVVIAKGVTLTIEPGTRIFFADYDIFNTGKDPDQSEIIVYGRLEAKSSPKEPILLNTIEHKYLKNLKLDDKTMVIKFYPYKVRTEPLREEFRSFKIQYLVLWSIIYAMCGM